MCDFKYTGTWLCINWINSWLCDLYDPGLVYWPDSVCSPQAHTVLHLSQLEPGRLPPGEYFSLLHIQGISRITDNNQTRMVMLSADFTYAIRSTVWIFVHV